ncbi:TetR/AcrR family transcriptional regulator [Clostridium kluyveri]|uniref:TetR/AcrR family transcriptional regulator n=1 Tax=Clostridium kluyveri TaxID=1534 RepID=UPI002246271D|nr:TetR/AcrR family transcriptional regulator [Clostridium kluyveri]UZQ51284.1 TetR/AcrR family transcriptional regulator [Clostridium kluyveri]
MNSKFERLEEPRKTQLINAALKEFSVKGYDKASTNIIAKESGLSKSLLFHYVDSKRELFLMLYDYAITTLLNDFFDAIDLTQKDLLKRCQQIAFVKIDLLHKSPALFDFFKIAVDTVSNDVKPELDKRNKDLRHISFDKLFAGVDKSLFRDDIDPDKAIDLIIWFLNGLADVLQQKVNHLRMEEINYEALIEESNTYFSIMKKCFYKEVF